MDGDGGGGDGACVVMGTGAAALLGRYLLLLLLSAGGCSRRVQVVLPTVCWLGRAQLQDCRVGEACAHKFSTAQHTCT